MLRIPRDLRVEVVRVRFGEDRVRSQGLLSGQSTWMTGWPLSEATMREEHIWDKEGKSRICFRHVKNRLAGE